MKDEEDFEDEEDEISLEDLAEQFKESLEDANPITRNISENLDDFLQEILRGGSPVLSRVAQGRGNSGLEGAFSGFENIQTGGEDETDEGGKYAGAVKYSANEEKIYNEAPSREGMEANTFRPDFVDIMSLGRNVTQSEKRTAGFVSSNVGKDDKRNSLDSNYVSAERVDMMGVGKERETVAKREYKIR